MARSWKARVEGAMAAVLDASGGRYKPAGDGDRKFVEAAGDPAPEVKAHPDPVPGDDGDAFARIAASFRARFPEDWEHIRLCPLQHGIDRMADLLRARD